MFLHPCLPFRIAVDVGAVVVEEIDLDVALSGPVEKIIFVGIEIWIVALDVGVVADVACSGGGQRQEIFSQRGFVRGAICPKGAARVPVCAEAGVVRDSVLNDQRLDALGMRQDHAKADRGAIVLHIQVVFREAHRFDEVIHDFGDAIERVGKFLRIGPIAVAEARIVGRNEMITVGQASEEWLEHTRRRRQSVQEENGGRVLWSGLAIKNREAVNLNRAIRRRMFHRSLLYLACRWA